MKLTGSSVETWSTYSPMLPSSRVIDSRWRLMVRRAQQSMQLDQGQHLGTTMVRRRKELRRPRDKLGAGGPFGATVE